MIIGGEVIYTSSCINGGSTNSGSASGPGCCSCSVGPLGPLGIPSCSASNIRNYHGRRKPLILMQCQDDCHKEENILRFLHC